jgi:hypothetical protein
MTQQQKPKRYLNSDEILDVMHNANKHYPPKEIGECPITKEAE